MDDTEPFNTLAYEFESDRVENTRVTEHGEEPPEELHDAVVQALRDTILPFIDGNRLIWRDEGRLWTLAFGNGLPELPVGEGKWLPPYRTMEKFTGVDGSGDGLIDTLPEEWAFEEKNSGAVSFYPER